MSLYPKPHRSRAALSLAVSLVLASAVSAQDADKKDDAKSVATMDTMIVTGSYIKRDNFDLASPINVVSADAIAETGAPNIGETLYNESFNFGVSRVQNFLLSSGSQTDGVVTRNNIRGLGYGATLELMNGKRSLANNANVGYPTMAIQRIETLLDGASALYGSQAVAGVVNYIPYTKFDGFRAMVDVRTIQAASKNELLAGFLAGTSSDRSHFVLGFETRHRDAVTTYDIPYLVDFAAQGATGLGSGQGYSGTGNPGSFNVPGRTATGALTANTKQRDPGCGNQAGNPGTAMSVQGNNLNGIINQAFSPNNCMLAYGEFWDHLPQIDGQNIYAHFDYDLTDHLRFKSEIVYYRNTDIGRGSPINSGDASGVTVVQNMIGGKIAGDVPGNPYRAFNDANGNGAIDAGEALFAQDMCNQTACIGQPGGASDGIPDRGLNGVFVPGAEKNVLFPVIVSGTTGSLSAGTGTPNVGSAAVGSTSIPFNEDVTIAAWRPIGKQSRGLPSSQNPDGSQKVINKFTFTRYSTGLEADLGKSWTVNLDYTFNNVLGVATGTDVSRSALALGFLGKLGPNQDQYYNPFSTAFYQCANRVCGNTATTSGTPGFNSQYVLDQVGFQYRTTTNTFNHVADLVIATNDLFSLPAGDVGLAVGGQYYIEKEDSYDDSRATDCDAWSRGCVLDFAGHRNTQAAFAQLQIPLFKTDLPMLAKLDLDLAGRYTVVQGKDGKFNPKAGLVYQPIDMLSVRGSWGTSYIAPSIRTERATTITNFQTTDPTCAFSGGNCSSAISQFILQRQTPSPDLKSETSDTINLGFTLRLLNNDLTIQADYVDISYTDRISSTNPQSILGADFPRFRAYIQSNCGASAVAATPPAYSATDLACQAQYWTLWTAHTNPALEDPAVGRAAGGLLSSVSGGYFNAASVKTSQVDLEIRYAFDIGSIGRFNIGSQGTWVKRFDVQDSPTAAVVSKLAKINMNEIYPSLPRWHVAPRLNWTLGDHSVTVLGQYHSAMEINATSNVPSSARFSLAYDLKLHDLLGSGESSVTLGALNVLDKKPFLYSTPNAYNPQWDDPLGRTWYVHLVHNF